MSINDVSKEELLGKLQQVSKIYSTALNQNAEIENLKRLYVELRELKWKILEFGYYGNNLNQSFLKSLNR